MRILRLVVGITMCTSILFLTACGPAAELPPSTTHEQITVMTYNILTGAGVDTVPPWGQKYAAQKGFPGNRLSKVLEVIKAADPDILGIQEADGWDKGSPSVAQKVADELGMNYFIAESKSRADVVLFTKFDIKEVESYPTQFASPALRAELVTPSDQAINVFVVHLHATDKKINYQELSFMLGEMESYIDDLTILIGDMNFFYVWGLKRLVEHVLMIAPHVTDLCGAGWCHCAGQDLDQIWTSPVLEPYAQPGPKIPSELTRGTSDHMPVVARVRIP